MSRFIIVGGYLKNTFNLCNDLHIFANIILYKSPNWATARVSVNNIRIHDLLESNRKHNIEMNIYNKTPTLQINDMIVYQNKQLFHYEVEIITKKPIVHRNFIKYYNTFFVLY